MGIRLALYRQLLKWSIRERLSGNAQLCDDLKSVYVLEKPFVADRLILELQLKKAGIAVSAQDIKAIDHKSNHRLQHEIEHLVAYQRQCPERSIKLQPIMVLAGHLPSHQQSLLRSFLTESWSHRGGWVRLLSLLLNGRSTLIRIDKPLNLRDLCKDELSDAEIARRAVWVLRTHFQRCRQAILGPDLSHRRTLMNQVLHSTEVKQAIAETAHKQGKSIAQTEKDASTAVDAIVADFSPATAKLLNHAIHFLLNRLFSRINLKGLDNIQQLALTHTLVYLPCHRSHLDYILLSWLLYRHGLMVPHVVAGDNLNIPVIGSILRRGGAIFMRRRFKDDPLYGTIFKQYLTLMLHRGHSIEYFIEGGRSRSGRLLSTKNGLLSMTLNAWQEAPSKPLALIPVAISYDRLVESQSYQKELAGAEKSKESLFSTLKSLSVIFQQYGEVHIGFGEALKINEEQLKNQGVPPVQKIGRQVIERINLSFLATPMSLIASILLSSPHLQIRETELKERLNDLIIWLDRNQLSFPPGSIDTWIDQAVLREQVTRGIHAISLTPEQAAELTFYRNMIMHQLILPGLILLFYRRLHRSGTSTQTRLLRAIYPYLRAELNLPDVDSQADLNMINAIRHQLKTQQMLKTEKEALPPLAEHLIRLAEPVLLRQYLLILVLTRLQKTTELELLEMTRELALHIHEHYGYAAPEYGDRRVFEGMTEQLLAQQILREDAEHLYLIRPLNNVLTLAEKLFPTSVIDRANQWLILKGVAGK